VNGRDALLQLKRELDEEFGKRRDMMFGTPVARTRRQLLMPRG
jgi:hypothetical protein